MEVEIVEVYLFSKRPNGTRSGSVHAYIPEMGMDLRGCTVSIRAKNIFVHLPYQKGFDEETQKPVFFPVVSFTDLAKMKDFKNSVVKAGVKAVKKALKEEQLLATKKAELVEKKAKTALECSPKASQNTSLDLSGLNH